METNYLKYFCIFLYLVKVNSIALKGSALTRYNPCGLGIIYFDKKMDNLWQGVVKFGLYRNLVEAEVDIYFENPVEIYEDSQNSSFTVKRSSLNNFNIKANGPIFPQYAFLLSLKDNNVSSVPTVLKFTLNNEALCNKDIRTAQTINSLNVKRPHGEGYAHVCGRRSLNNTELVSVRTEAKAGDWPWHVAVIVDLDSKETKCGGSIISRNTILTAGHCVVYQESLVTADRIKVIAGVDNYIDLDQIGRQTFIALEVILHPGYKSFIATSDLAIIKVNGLKYTEYVQPICVWGPAYDKSKLFGHEAMIVGFGGIENNTQSHTLRASSLKIQNDSVCIAYDPEMYTKLLNEFTFCAGYGPNGGINPRQGDSGSGLVLAKMQPDHKISWFLRGVFSQCIGSDKVYCDPKNYVVYTDVGPHSGWIYHHSGLQITNNNM